MLALNSMAWTLISAIWRNKAAIAVNILMLIAAISVCAGAFMAFSEQEIAWLMLCYPVVLFLK